MAKEEIYEKARKAANMGNYEYATELFREVLRHEPEHPEARLLLRGTERKRASEKAGGLSAPAAYIAVLVPLLKAQLYIKNPEKRLECYEDALEKLPENIFISIRAGKSAVKSGFSHAAITIFKDILSRAPENKAALRHLGEQLEAIGESREALKYLNRLSQLKPNDRELAGQVKNLEAEAHMKESKMDEAESFRDMIKDEEAAQEAVKRFETADEKRAKQIQQALSELKAEPDNINKIIRMANLFQDDGQHVKAVKLLQKARQRHPEHYDIRMELGNLQLRIMGKKENAMQEKLNASPDDNEIKEKLDSLVAKRKEVSVREYKWRVKKHPTDRSLKLKLGDALFEKGDIDAAIASFQQAVQSPTLELEAATMLGKCFAMKGQHDLAVEQFDRALALHKTLDAKGMNLQYEKALALEAAGEKKQALDIYKLLYSNDINFKNVAEKVEKLDSTS